MKNVFKYAYGWRVAPFKALKDLFRNCRDRLTKGYCRYDIYDLDEYLTMLLTNTLEELAQSYERGIGEVNIETLDGVETVDGPHIAWRLRTAIYDLNASQDRSIPTEERLVLRTNAFKIINKYFDNLWW